MNEPISAGELQPCCICKASVLSNPNGKWLLVSVHSFQADESGLIRGPSGESLHAVLGKQTTVGRRRECTHLFVCDDCSPKVLKTLLLETSPIVGLQ